MMTTLEANTKYVNLINHFKMFPPKDGEYFEAHHIVPRVIAPDLANDKTNLVKLPYHAHVLAHLYYAYSLEDGDKHKFGQINAVMHMLSVKNKKQHISEEFILEHAEELDAAKAKFRELARIAKKGKHLSDEHKKKIGEAMSKALKGKPKSDGHKQKISAAHKGKPSPLKGKKRSDDTKKKISEAMNGKHLSDETKKKMSASRSIPLEIDSIRFESQKDAAKHFGVSQPTIRNWLNNPEKYQTHVCKYVDKV